MCSALPIQDPADASEPPSLDPRERALPRVADATWEESAYITVRGVRDRLLRPIVAPLARLGAPPTLVSLLGVAFALSTCWTLPEHPRLALAGFIAALLCDAVDGALARHRSRSSVAGKVVDQLADFATFSALMAALWLAGLASAAGLAFAVVAALVLLALGFSYHTRRRSPARRLQPRGGFFAHCPKAMIYGALAIYLIADLDWIGPILGLANALAVLFALGFVGGLTGRGREPIAGKPTAELGRVADLGGA